MGSYLFSPQVALLTEHLEHTPITLIDEIINSINLLVTDSLNIFENTINQSPKIFGYPDGPDGPGSLSPASQHEISNGMHQLETLLGALIDKNFDKFEIYALRNVLTVPDGLVGWVKLPHHKGYDFKPRPTDAPLLTATAPPATPAAAPAPNEGYAWYHPTHPTNDTFTRLREKLIASHYLNQTLKTEVSSNAALISKLKSALANTSPTDTAPSASLSFLTTSTPTTLHPLPTTAEFIALQISSIRSLLATLPPKLTTSSDSLTSPTSDDDEENTPLAPDLSDLDPTNPSISPNERRKRYIEKMIRRHMQKQRRIKLTRRGEVVGGEYWDGVAASCGGVGVAGEKRRGLEEVVALERLFGIEGGGEEGKEKE
ncbi:Mis12 protein-domain-containing protein [Terfezia claveryi]|nr:Mis12 protein-domain-containing protein [Terfezia claveryi]